MGIASFHRALSQVLVVVNQQKKLLLATILGAVVNVILNIFLIPRFSLYGAAYASLITNLFIFILYFAFVVKSGVKPVDPRIFLISSIAFLSSLMMYFIVSLKSIYYLNIFILVALGIAVYFLCLFPAKFLADHFLKFKKI